MGLCDEVPLFVQTNLGTHFALSVPQDITAGDLKDSMAIKHVLKELSRTWLLHVDASSMQNTLEDQSLAPFTSKLTMSNSSPHSHNQSQKPVSVAYCRTSSQISNDGSEFLHQEHFLNTSSSKNLKERNIIEHNDTDECYKWAKNREVKSTSGPSFNTEHQFDHDCYKAIQKAKSTVSEHPIEGMEHESLSILENSRKSSQTVSVTGIISRFFSELDEVDSCYSQPKHIHETVQMLKDELGDSKIRTLASQSDHMRDRKSVVSEADAHCSFVKKQEGNTTERDKVALEIKKKQLRSKKQVNKKSLLCTSQISPRMCMESFSSKSCKYQVGKRLIQAANSIKISGCGKRSATKLLSKFKNLTSSDSGSFVRRRIAFDVEHFAD